MTVSSRPRWSREIQTFLKDTIIDERYGWPDDDSADRITDEIERAVDLILCREFGHEIELDQCMIPSHAYCVHCSRGVVDINHMTHAQQCDCLDDSDVCCVDSCPCPRVSRHGSET